MSNTSADVILTFAEQAAVERERPALAAPRRRTAAARWRERRDQQAGAEHHPRPAARQPADLGDATGDVAQRDRGSGHDPADEAAAGLVVPGEQQLQRSDHHRDEHDAHRHVEGHEPAERHGRRCGARRAGVAARRAPGRRPARARATVPIAAAASTRDLAERVEAAEVDEDHVDDVASVALRAAPARSSCRRRGSAGRCAPVAIAKHEDRQPPTTPATTSADRPAATAACATRSDPGAAAARARTARS